MSAATHAIRAVLRVSDAIWWCCMRVPPPGWDRLMRPYGGGPAPSAASATPRMRNWPRPRSGGVGAQLRVVRDDHGAPASLDPAHRAHLRQRLRDGLARRPAPAGELLLRERQRDLDAVVA